MTLPAELLHAIAHSGGGRVVLVIGAGASVELPTGLPLSRECSVEAHRRLVADGVLSDGDCTDEEDLSCVADAVVSATGGQRELVERLPLDKFRHAEPNEGYLIAAALLRERAVACVMTLNFDLGMSGALMQVGAREDVGVVSGPDEHHRLAGVNLIYLHRNVNAGSDSWILRTAALENEWRAQWEDVIAHRVIGGPVTVFAGLGTPAGVLVATTVRIRTAIPDGAHVFQVDPGERESSVFFTRLDLPDTAYLRMGWSDFMSQLAARVVEEHRSELESTCRQLISIESWDDEDPADLCRRLSALGLVGLGRLRARWTLNAGPYVPRHLVTAEWVADLTLAIGLIEQSTGTEAVFEDDGVVELRRGDRVLGSVIVASGRGIRRWLALEAEVAQHSFRRRRRDPKPHFALVGAIQGERPDEVAPPSNVAIGDEPQSIVTGGSALELISVEELRDSPAVAQRMVA
jgi:hypothetical protein